MIAPIVMIVARAWLPVGLVVFAACGPTKDTAGNGGSSTGNLDACSLDQSPFVQEACLEALRRECNAHADEQACTDAPPFEVGYAIACGWATIVAIADASSCAVESTSGRCEAFTYPGDGFCPPCFAIEDRSEIVVGLCGGPLGPWSVVGSDGDGVGSCGASLVPPEPALCSCAPAECDL